MKRMLGIGVVALSFALISASAYATDAAALYKAKCSPCHGNEGVGTPMAPAHAGNKWIKSASKTDIFNTIRDGRQGAQKHYKQFPIGMPAQKTMSAADINALVDYLKTLAAK